MSITITQLYISVYDKKANNIVEETLTNFTNDHSYVHKVACRVFAVQEAWDMELIRSLLINNDRDWFELYKPSQPHIAYGLTFKGDKNLKEGPVFKIQHKSMTLLMHKEAYRYDETIRLSSADIEKKYSNDNTLISFYNCSSFNQLMECKTIDGDKRTLTKGNLFKL